MARKRRAPSPPPPPPPPPPQESSSEESGSKEEEDSPSHPARRMPPPAAAADGADSLGGSGSDSDSDDDAQAFQLRQVHRSPTKLPPRPVPHPESHAAAAAAAADDDDDDEEDESSESESEPENPEPVVQNKAAAAGKSKAEQERKRPVADPAPSGPAKKAKAGAEKAAVPAEATPPGKAKKGKAESEKAAPEAAPAGKVKKGKAEQKAVPEATPAGKVKKVKAEGEKAASEDTSYVKGKKGGTKTEKPGVLDSSPPSSKPEKHRWTKNDKMKILEALAEHVKSEGALPKTDFLLATVGNRLDRKNCTYSDIYEKVRQLKGWYEKVVSTGTVPRKEDELQLYKLSEAVWGEKAKEAIAAARSQNDGAVTKSKKGQANKQKMDGNSKGGEPKEAAASTANQDGDSQKGSKKEQATKEKTDRGVKSRLSKEATTTGTPSKSKKHDNQNEELDKDAKIGDLGRSKGEKNDKGKMDIDRDSLKSMGAAAANQNGGTLTKNKKRETHDDEIERDANVEVTRRGFDELQGLYSNLAAYVEEIEVQNPSGETLKRAFEFIGDEKAESLEDKVRKQRVSEVKAELRRADVKKDVLNTLLSLGG